MHTGIWSWPVMIFHSQGVVVGPWTTETLRMFKEGRRPPLSPYCSLLSVLPLCCCHFLRLSKFCLFVDSCSSSSFSCCSRNFLRLNSVFVLFFLFKVIIVLDVRHDLILSNIESNVQRNLAFYAVFYFSHGWYWMWRGNSIRICVWSVCIHVL